MNYYNEFNAEAAAWLRQLIEEDLIPAGIVDTRSICDVTPADLKGFNQCHFFAGIGGWPLALQRAGVSPNTELWSGSCPCQPFSSAGRQKGTEDERHLWPVFARLIAQCRPPVVLGEQVDSAIGHGWLDGVCTDLEAEGYATGAAVLPACGINAPHRRNRLWWAGVLAENADGGGCGGRRDADSTGDGREVQVAGLGDGRAMAHSGNHRAGSLSGSAQDADGNPWMPGRRACDKHTGRLAQVGLTHEAMAVVPLATPNSRDWKDTTGMAQEAENPDGSQRIRLDQLPRQCALLSIAPTGSTAGCQLNPYFSAWMMGYPSIWTECAIRAMAIHSARKKPSRTAAPCSTDTATPSTPTLPQPGLGR